MLVRTRTLSVPYGCCGIKLQGEYFTLVSPEDLNNLMQYHWFAKRSGSAIYAVRKILTNGKTFFLRMHRQIMHTPPGMIVHHLDGYSMNNRRENLINMAKCQHAFYH